VFFEAKTSTPDTLKTWDDCQGHFGDRVKSLSAARRRSNEFVPGTPDAAGLVAKLREAGLSGKWRIPKNNREMLECDLNMDTDTLLSKLTIVAQNLAVPTISVFHVGAAVLGASGDVYIGPNVEFCSGLYSSNLCGFHYVLHAEQAAVLCALSHGEKSVSKLCCSHVPCGMCRQFLTELPDFRNLSVWSPQMPPHQKLGDLLPHAFGPLELGKNVTLLSNSVLNPISLPLDSEALQLDQIMAEKVELAAQRAYAPYTSSYAGAVLRLKNGEYCSGSCIESVAFNPSVTPLQMALLMLFASGAHVEDIEAACLAEDPTAAITFKGSDHALLSAVSPWVSLWLIPLTRDIDGKATKWQWRHSGPALEQFM
jgi:cytidine deaminase